MTFKAVRKALAHFGGWFSLVHDFLPDQQGLYRRPASDCAAFRNDVAFSPLAGCRQMDTEHFLNVSLIRPGECIAGHFGGLLKEQDAGRGL